MIREVLDSITYKRLSEFYSLVMGGSINEKDEFGYGILHSAISSEFDEAAIYYIEHGGDVNAQDNNGATALHYCAAYKNKIIAKRLTEVGASFEIADRHGNEPLCIEVSSEHLATIQETTWWSKDEKTYYSASCGYVD